MKQSDGVSDRPSFILLLHWAKSSNTILPAESNKTLLALCLFLSKTKKVEVWNMLMNCHVTNDDDVQNITVISLVWILHGDKENIKQ